MSGAPLVSARDLRVDVDGAVVLDHVTLEVFGASLAVWSDGYDLERALAGRARIRSGSLTLLGRPLHGPDARPAEAIGIALCDPPLAPRWSVREYLVAGAKLAGSTRKGAQAIAARTIAELGLGPLAASELGQLPLAERRAVVIAQAIASAPLLLIAVAPLAGLSGEPASYVAAVLAAASRERRWIALVRDLHPASPEHALAASADAVVGFAGGRVVQQGKLALGGSPTIGYTLVVRGEVEALRRALAARGATLAGGPLRFFVEARGDLDVSEILALSHAARAPIVELVPRLANRAPVQLEK